MYLLQFSDSDTIFLKFMSHFNLTYINTFNTLIQKALKILVASILFPPTKNGIKDQLTDLVEFENPVPPAPPFTKGRGGH